MAQQFYTNMLKTQFKTYYLENWDETEFETWQDFKDNSIYEYEERPPLCDVSHLAFFQELLENNNQTFEPHEVYERGFAMLAILVLQEAEEEEYKM